MIQTIDVGGYKNREDRGGLVVTKIREEGVRVTLETWRGCPGDQSYNYYLNIFVMFPTIFVSPFLWGTVGSYSCIDLSVHILFWIS